MQTTNQRPSAQNRERAAFWVVSRLPRLRPIAVMAHSAGSRINLHGANRPQSAPTAPQSAIPPRSTYVLPTRRPESAFQRDAGLPVCLCAAHDPSTNTVGNLQQATRSLGGGLGSTGKTAAAGRSSVGLGIGSNGSNSRINSTRASSSITSNNHTIPTSTTTNTATTNNTTNTTNTTNNNTAINTATTTTTTTTTSPTTTSTSTTRIVVEPHTSCWQHNFWQVLPSIRRAVEASSFVAVDCEMTGLWARGYGPSRLEDYQSRYQQLKESAEKFMLVQVGLSCFTRHPDQPDSWVVQTFNVTLYPVTNPQQWNPMFGVGASSLEFLSQQGFDIGAWVRDGARFLPLQQRLLLMAQLEVQPAGPAGPAAAAAAAAAAAGTGTVATAGNGAAPGAGAGAVAGNAAAAGAAAAGAGKKGTSANSSGGPGGSVKVKRVPETGELFFTGMQPGDDRIAAIMAAARAVEAANGVGDGVGSSGSSRGGRDGGGGEAQRQERWLGVRREVLAWLLAGEEGPGELCLPAAGGPDAHMIEALVRMELLGRPDLPPFSCTVMPPGASSHSPAQPAQPASSSQPASGSQPASSTQPAPAATSSGSSWQVQLVRQVPWTQDNPGRSKGQLVRRGAVHRAAGPSVLLEILRDAGKPLVVHNGMLDVAIILAHLRGSPLPNSWDGYKALTNRWFPGGVYDTKHLAGVLAGSSSSSATGTVAGGNSSSGPQGAPASLQELPLQGLFARVSPNLTTSHTTVRPPPDVPGGYLEAALGILQQASVTLPECEAPDQSNAATTMTSVQGSDSDAEPVTTLDLTLDLGSSGDGGLVVAARQLPTHEAGFDALMTGAVFASFLEDLRPSMQHGSMHVDSSTQQSSLSQGSEAMSSTMHQGSVAMDSTMQQGSLPNSTNTQQGCIPMGGGGGGSGGGGSTSWGPASPPLQGNGATHHMGPHGAHLQHMGPHAWRLHGHRGVPYYSLSGPDPAPALPAAFIISGLGPKTTWYEVSKRWQACGLGPVLVLMLDTTPGIWGSSPRPQTSPRPRPQQPSAAKSRAVKAVDQAVGAVGGSCFVELLKPELAPRVMEAAGRLNKGWVVTPVADWWGGA